MDKNKVYIETYGCQINLADSEIVKSILKDKGYNFTDDLNSANVILLNVFKCTTVMI